jgi:hypothetical protein
MKFLNINFQQSSVTSSFLDPYILLRAFSNILGLCSSLKFPLSLKFHARL